MFRMRRQHHDCFRPLPKPRGFAIWMLSAHAQRGDAVCTNGLLVRRAEPKRQLLGGLRERMIHADVVGYALKSFEDEIAKALTARSNDMDDLRRQESKLEHGIANQLRGQADGYSPTSRLRSRHSRPNSAPYDHGWMLRILKESICSCVTRADL
jgi:hypothetical protein